jgi:hypothetical protein
MRRSTIVLPLLALVLLFLPGSRARSVSNFEPCAVSSLASTAAGAPSDVTTTFGVQLDPATCARFSSPEERPGQYDVQKIVYFTPPQWHVAVDSDIPDGTRVGTLRNRMTLGLLNNPCSIVLNANFNLYDATVDRANTVDAKAPGQPNRLSPMAGEANGPPAAATKWPSYLDSVAQMQGMDLSQLIARIVGVDKMDVPGTTLVTNLLVFRPGAHISSEFATDPSLGYPTVLIFQDPSAAASSQDPTNDFCAPFWSELTLDGTAGGTPFRTSPGDGTYDFVTWAQPQPDADSDGIDDTLDPCPYNPNASGWDPRGQRSGPGDPDSDGIPSDCDPLPNQPSQFTAETGIAQADEDGDGWQNLGDNCPLIQNGQAQAAIPGVGNQLDSDGDGIGDVCDHNPAQVDGEQLPVCLVTQVFIGGGGPSPEDPTQDSPCTPRTPFSADTNCDSRTDAADLLAELEDEAGIAAPPCPGALFTGCDGVIGADDITTFLRYLAGFYVLPPICQI